MAHTKLQGAASVSRGRITARVPQDVLHVLEQAADIVGSTLSQFVIQAAQEKAEKIVANQHIIGMPDDDAAWFFNLLDNPPPPSPALLDAFKHYNAGKIADEGSNSSFGHSGKDFNCGSP